MRGNRVVEHFNSASAAIRAHGSLTYICAMELFGIIYFVGWTLAMVHSVLFVEEMGWSIFAGVFSWYYFSIYYGSRDLAWLVTLFAVCLW